MKKILIIGGTGYIGSALFRFLSAQLNGPTVPVPQYYATVPKYAIDTVDLEWFGNTVNPSNLIMDFRDLTAEQLAKYDVVILLAGHSSVPMANNSDPESTFKNNVRNFVNLMHKLRAGQKFIYAGSASVYNGIPDDNVTEEYTLLTPSNIYDLTKQDIDLYASVSFPHIESYGLRFATVNGLSENLRTDIMINAMVETALTQREVKLFNPNIRRPILHIHDLCRAFQAVIDCPDDRRGVYNLSSFNGTSGDIAEGVATTMGVTLHEIEQGKIEQVVGSKLPPAYDFSVSAEKFCRTFNFAFQGYIERIVEELANNFEHVTSGKRIRAVNYL